MVAKQPVKINNKILPPSPILFNSQDDKNILIWPKNVFEELGFRLPRAYLNYLLLRTGDYI